MIMLAGVIGIKGISMLNLDYKGITMPSADGWTIPTSKYISRPVIE